MKNLAEGKEIKLDQTKMIFSKGLKFAISVEIPIIIRVSQEKGWMIVKLLPEGNIDE